MPFPPVRCYRSLSCYLLCRLFPFGQLLCLFARFLHYRNRTFRSPLYYQALTAGCFRLYHCLASKTPRFTRTLHFAFFLYSVNRQKATRCQCLCSPALPPAALRIFADTSPPLFHATQKSYTVRPRIYILYRSRQPVALATTFTTFISF
jgi:hypothetical protein